MSDILTTLKLLMIQKDINENQLANLSGVPQSTINSFFRKNNTPSISTLDQLCQGLDLTLSNFFMLVESENALEVAEKESDYTFELDNYQLLTRAQKRIINTIIQEFTTKTSK